METASSNSTEWLWAENNCGYGALPIPQLRDAQISVLLREWELLDIPAKTVALSQMSMKCKFTLLAYSERKASMAVRNHDKDCIILGLLALCLDSFRGDWRENIPIMCLHYDAARRIGVSPEESFRSVAGMVPDRSAQYLLSFLKRSDEDKSLESMGYAVGADDDGFLFLRAW